MKKILIIGGATASGKSEYALKLAKNLGGAIINADALQVYKELPILTSQPAKNDIEHKLYGVLSIVDSCSAGIWANMAKSVIDEVIAKGKTPIVVGGTGLYIKTLIYGIAEIPNVSDKIKANVKNKFEELGKEKFYQELTKLDPLTLEKIRPSDKERMIRAMEVIKETGKSIMTWRLENKKTFFSPDQFQGYFLNPSRKIIYRNCNERFLKMIDNGALEEVKSIQSLGLSDNSNAKKILGFKELLAYLVDQIPKEDAIQKAQQKTRNYAKRQITWFRHQLPILNELVDF